MGDLVLDPNGDVSRALVSGLSSRSDLLRERTLQSLPVLVRDSRDRDFGGGRRGRSRGIGSSIDVILRRRGRGRGSSSSSSLCGGESLDVAGPAYDELLVSGCEGGDAADHGRVTIA